MDGHSVLAELEKELADPNTSEVRWDQAPLGDLLIHILASYALPHDGVHGLRHRARVLENGRRLSELTGADPQVVDLFALFHDCCRVDEGTDPGHGLRGGEFAKALYNSGTLELSPDQFALLDEWAGGSSSLALELLS